MTWQAAHTFCLQQNSGLANLTDFQNINMTTDALNDGRRYWINGAQIKVYAPQDPLQTWYWLNGTQLNTTNRRGVFGELSYTVSGEEETCALIRGSRKHIWEDSPCGAYHSFICKAGGGNVGYNCNWFNRFNRKENVIYAYTTEL